MLLAWGVLSLHVCLHARLCVFMSVWMGLSDPWLRYLALKKGTVQSEPHRFQGKERVYRRVNQGDQIYRANEKYGWQRTAPVMQTTLRDMLHRTLLFSTCLAVARALTSHPCWSILPAWGVLCVHVCLPVRLCLYVRCSSYQDHPRMMDCPQVLLPSSVLQS